MNDNRIGLGVCIAIASAAISCTPKLSVTELKSSKPPRTREMTAPGLQSWVDGTAQFGYELYQAVPKENGNLFISPFSVSCMLAMLFPAAGEPTRSEIAEILQIPTEFDVPEAARRSRERAERSPLQLSASIWTQRDLPVSESYLDTLAESFDAGVQQVDFSDLDHACEQINRWVKRQTEGAFDNVVSPRNLSPPILAVLVDTIRFVGHWELPFEKSQTEPSEFTMLDGSSIQVPTMRLEESLPYARGGDADFLRLEYEKAEASMLLILPEPGKFTEVEANLSLEWLRTSLETTPLQRRQVRLALPRVKMRSEIPLDGVLTSLGLTSAFGPDANWEALGSDTVLGEVAQHAELIVDEEGTQATAVTVAGIPLSEALPLEIISLSFDRPFLLVISDGDLTRPLFIGRIVDPRS